MQSNQVSESAVIFKGGTDAPAHVWGATTHHSPGSISKPAVMVCTRGFIFPIKSANYTIIRRTVPRPFPKWIAMFILFFCPDNSASGKLSISHACKCVFTGGVTAHTHTNTNTPPITPLLYNYSIVMPDRQGTYFYLFLSINLIQDSVILTRKDSASVVDFNCLCGNYRDQESPVVNLSARRRAPRIQASKAIK